LDYDAAAILEPSEDAVRILGSLGSRRFMPDERTAPTDQANSFSKAGKQRILLGPKNVLLSRCS
jgi:hypothetical protein